MKRRRAVSVDTFDIASAEMCDAELPTRERDDDLPGMEVSGEGQVKRVGDPSRDAGKVTEENSQARRRICKLIRACLPRSVGPRVDAYDLDAPASKLELDALVAQQRDVFERIDRSRIDPLRERVAAVGEIVVPEHDEAGAELAEEPLEQRHPCAARHEITGNADDVRAPLDDPCNGIHDCASAAGRNAEMEIGEVRDAKPVELRR